MNKTFQTIRATVLTTAFLAVSSTAAFGQPQPSATSDAGDPVRNAVAFKMTCNVALNCIDATGIAIPRGHRLVITRVSASVGSPGNFILAGSLNGEEVVHIFPIRALSSLDSASGAGDNCFVVLDSISKANSYLFLTGNGTVRFSGYLVKM